MGDYPNHLRRGSKKYVMLRIYPKNNNDEQKKKTRRFRSGSGRYPVEWKGGSNIRKVRGVRMCQGILSVIVA